MPFVTPTSISLGSSVISSLSDIRTRAIQERVLVQRSFKILSVRINRVFMTVQIVFIF